MQTVFQTCFISKTTNRVGHTAYEIARDPAVMRRLTGGLCAMVAQADWTIGYRSLELAIKWLLVAIKHAY